MTIMTPNVEFSSLASDERVAATTAALEANGIRTIVTGSGDEARQVVLDLLPPGAEVFTATSRTLESIGLAAEIPSSHFLPPNHFPGTDGFCQLGGGQRPDR